MIYGKIRSVPALIAGMFLIAAAGWGVMPAGAGGGTPGHGHEKAEKGRGEEKGHGGGMPMSGGQMKMGGHEKAEEDHGEEKGHGGGMPMSGGQMKMGGQGGGMKGLTKIQAKGFGLVSALHCNACHFVTPELAHGAGHGGGHGGVAPDLTFLGDKFRPEWLYEFIRKPHTIRPWLDIRMPDFRLTESETVSLVKHLSRDMRAPSRFLVPLMPITNFERKAYLDAGKKLMSKDYFDCFGCHQLGDKKPDKPVNEWAPDLTMAARRLRPEWIVRWIQGPQKILKGTRMPTFFEDKDSGPDDILGGDEEKQIRALTEYILSLGGVEKGGPGPVSPVKRGPGAAGAAVKRPAIYALAEKRNPGASRSRGARLMNELNCAGCHDVGGMHEKLEAGPPLAHEGSRVKKSWLTGFLKNPFRIRPSGYTAGSSSRMPDFRLSGEETEAITAFLMTRVDKRSHADEKPHAPSKAKAGRGARLFAGLRCGACHQVKAGGDKKGKGPFAGPDLTRAGQRLQEEHLRFYLAGEVTQSGSKLEMDAHPLIPKMGLSKEEVEDLAAYVSTLK